MGFLFCPRLRSYQKASSSLDETPAYNLGHAEPNEGYKCNPVLVEVSLLTDIGTSSSIDEQVRSKRASHSSGTLSSKIRRRFSRDGRDLYKQSKKSERKPKVPFLHSQPKSPVVRAPPVGSHRLGGSLTSDKGYDSDAHSIATPRDGMAKPARQSPLPSCEPSIRTRKEGSGSTADTKGIAYDHFPYNKESDDLRRFQTPEHRRPQVSRGSPSSLKSVDLRTPRGRPSSPSPNLSRARDERRVPSPGPVPTRMHEMHQAQVGAVVTRAPTPRGGSSEGSASQRSGRGNDTITSIYSSPHVPQQHGFTTSADSLSGCPQQINIRKRHQRPRKKITTTTHGDQSVHLGEMNIHRALASSGSTSRLQSQVHLIDETRSSSYTATWNASRYQTVNNPAAMPPIWDTPEGKPPLPDGIRDPQSPYSPLGSITSVGYDHDEQRLPSFSPPSPSNIPPRQTYSPSEHASASEAAAAEEANALRSRFTERFGSDSSVSPVVPDQEGDNEIPSRKISIGWMSEGRRIGYGYTLVPPDLSNEGQDSKQVDSGLPEDCGSTKESPKDSLAGSVTRSPLSRSPLAERKSQAASKTSESSFDISALLQKLNLPRWTGANLGVGTSTNSDAGSCDSGGSSLLGILTNRKKTHEKAVSNLEAENPWEFCSWVRPTQSLGGQQAPSQDGAGSYEQAEAQLIEKLQTLRRRKGAWATKRKVSQLAREFEKRADRAVANLATSTDRFPIVQRTATRVLRLRGPGKERPHGMRDGDLSAGDHSHIRPSGRLSSGSSGDWDRDSLYEECLEEYSNPE